MKRIIVCNRADSPLFDLNPNDVFELKRLDVVNGEHSLSITTSQILEQGQRVLLQDYRQKWHEYVVMGVDAEHGAGQVPIGTYYCVWSVQPDLMGTRVSAMPGTQTPVAAAVALEAALGGTARWSAGTVTNTKTGGASMYDTDGWSAISTLLEVWGGELDTTIEVGSGGVASRSVDLYTQQGDQTAKRRYDFGSDLRSVKRTLPDSPLYCRITPRGKGEETEGGGYGRKITIESVNDGKDYLVNSQMVSIARLPNGSGGWEYPTLEIENNDCETPADLKTWAESVLDEYTLPKVSYDVDVIQAATEGVDLQGVSLGDAVQLVDRTFGDGLRLSARVVEVETDELDEGSVRVKLGYVDEGLAGAFKGFASSVRRLNDTVLAMNGGTYTTAEYLNRLLERLNTEINATGGYTYITEGQGIRTYNRAVTDPLVGAEATAVVEIKGGTIRIANSKTAQGAWEWKTVFTSGHIAASVVTAAHLTAGYIGSPSGNYWNLDTGELVMQGYATDSDLSGVSATASAAQSTASAAQSTASAAQSTASAAQSTASAANTTAQAANTTAQAASAEAKKSAGGTNLLIDTNNSTKAKKAATADRKTGGSTGVTNEVVVIAASARPAGGCTYCYRATFAANGSGKLGYISYYDNKAVKLVEGQKYTVSCWAKRGSGTASLKFQHGQTSYKASTWLALSTGWKRYSWTFTFNQSAVGGSGGTRVYFYTKATSATATNVMVTGMKLELGEKATDWSAAPEDDNYGYTNALALAKTYTNAVSEADREYTAAQRDALDESLNQSKIFNRLTNNGRAQGLVLNDGKLYINGSYIQTDTLNAGIIKTGILTDKAGKNRWNMATGYMANKNAEFTNCNVAGYLTSGTSNKAQFNNGSVRFFNGTKNALTIDGAMKFSDGNYGAHVTFPKYLVFRGPELAVDDRTTGNGTTGATYTLQILIPTAGFAHNTKGSGVTDPWPSINVGTWNPNNPRWAVLSLRFVNGICCGAECRATS